MSNLDNDAELVAASYTLSMRRTQNPQLGRAEARARLRFAAAVIVMDEADRRIEAGLATHSLTEQMAVEEAKEAYIQATVDLIRGDDE